jgi:hypothetical protein
MKLVLNKSAALGNGDRPAGFVLGETTATTLAGVDAHNTQLAEGVLPCEIMCVKRNPQLLNCGPSEVAAVTQRKSESFWRDQPLDAVPNLTAEQLTALAGAKLKTLGDFVDFQENKGTGQSIGLDETGEMAILVAIDQAIAK